MTEIKEYSNRAKDWMAFSDMVLSHIETYTVPQYGDKPNDLRTNSTVSEIKQDVLRYMSRLGSNSRGAGESLLDMIKAAHYAQMMHEKLSRYEGDKPLEAV